MEFINQFKITYTLVGELGGSFYKLFEPMLCDASMAYDSGDIETAVQKLNFINSKLVECLETTGIIIK